MTSIVDHAVPELDSMKKYPDPLYYRGELSLLDRPKVSIVGTRKPSPYTRQYTYDLARALSRRGVVSSAARRWGSMRSPIRGPERPTRSR